jgi:hypothetical protein
MTDERLPDKDGTSDPEPTETLNVQSFSEVETRGPGGTGFRITGPGTPDHLIRTVLPGVLMLTGLVTAGAIIIAGQPFWQAMTMLAISLLLAAVAKYVPMPRGEGK